MFDGKAFGQEVVAAVKAHMDKALGSVLERLEAVERKLAALPVPQDGKSVTLEDVAPMIRGEIERVAGEVARSVPEMIEAAMAVLPKPEDGKDASPEMVREVVSLELDSRGASPEAMQALTQTLEKSMAEMRETFPLAIEHEVAKAIAAIPPAKPGKDADPAVIKQMVDAAVAALPPPQPGKDADPVQVSDEIRSEVAKAVSALPAAKDGHTPTPEELAPLVADAVSKAVSALPVAKDGVGLAGALIDRDGELAITMTDGRVQKLGRVVGRDGADVDMVALERRASEMIAALPKPKDGVDAVGFDHMDLVETGDGVFLRFARGDVVKDFRLPIVIDRGVFKEGRSYRKGDGVTWGGCFWIAQKDGAESKPDAGGAGWRLAVKRGRDGKDGVLKTVKPIGPVKV